MYIMSKYSKKKSIPLNIIIVTGKSLSEALILASTHPQYDDRVFMKIASSEHA